MGCATRSGRRLPAGGCKSLGGNNNEQKGIQRKEHDRDCGHVGGIVYIDAA